MKPALNQKNLNINCVRACYQNEKAMASNQLNPNGGVRHLLVRIVTICILMGAASSLRCYQCVSTSLEPCPPTDLQECGRFFFDNRCATRYRQMVSGEMIVKRECSYGCSDGYDTWNRGQNIRLSEHTRQFPVSKITKMCRGGRPFTRYAVKLI